MTAVLWENGKHRGERFLAAKTWLHDIVDTLNPSSGGPGQILGKPSVMTNRQCASVRNDASLAGEIGNVEMCGGVLLNVR